MMLKKKNILLLLSLSLSACSMTYQENKKKLDSETDAVNNLLKSSGNDNYKKSFDMVKFYKDGVYIGLNSFVVKQGENLPVNVEADGVKLLSARKMSLGDIAKMITTSTGIAVSVNSSNAGDENKTAASTDADMFRKLDAVVNNSVSPQQQMGVYDNIPGMTVNYSGKLSGFLKNVSSFFGISWQYMNGVIYFSPYEVRTFSINTLPVKLSSQSGMSSGSSSGGGGGDTGGSDGGSSSSGGGGGSLAATNSSSLSLNLDFWADIKQNIGIILNGNGSFNAAEGLASITVSTTPTTMINVQRYIDKLNETLRQEVAVNMTIYNIMLNEESDWNYSLTAMFSALKGRINGTMAFLSGDVKGGINGTTEGGSKFILDIMNTQGKVDLLNSANLTTLSGQSVPLQVSNSRGYVSSVGSSATDKTTQSTMTVSTINSGFFLNVLPRVLSDGKILLQYSLSMSTLEGKNNGFDEFTVDKQTLQLPNINQRAFTQNNILNNNQTLIVAGYKNSEKNISDRGVGSPYFKLLGGKQAAKNRKEIIIITVTPVALMLGDK